MKKDLIKTSKFLALVLRHDPQSIGLTLDSEGWADIAGLLAAAARNGKVFDRATLQEIVDTNEKKRYAISDDGLRIRAVQGHSTDSVALSHAEQTPPEVLFHGTATRFLDSILAEGLKPGTRHHVHLSADVQTAITVGQRHGKPAVLRIDAVRMQAQQHRFYLSENGVWLIEHVPAAFLALIEA
jgi:putative RNA 2'-phosphotransferase